MLSTYQYNIANLFYKPEPIHSHKSAPLFLTTNIWTASNSVQFESEWKTTWR